MPVSIFKVSRYPWKPLDPTGVERGSSRSSRRRDAPGTSCRRLDLQGVEIPLTHSQHARAAGVSIFKAPRCPRYGSSSVVSIFTAPRCPRDLGGLHEMPLGDGASDLVSIFTAPRCPCDGQHHEPRSGARRCLDLHGAEMPLRRDQLANHDGCRHDVSIFTAPRCPCDGGPRASALASQAGLDLHGAEMPLRRAASEMIRVTHSVSIFTAPRCPCDSLT